MTTRRALTTIGSTTAAAMCLAHVLHGCGGGQHHTESSSSPPPAEPVVAGVYVGHDHTTLTVVEPAHHAGHPPAPTNLESQTGRIEVAEPEQGRLQLTLASFGCVVTAARPGEQQSAGGSASPDGGEADAAGDAMHDAAHDGAMADAAHEHDAGHEHEAAHGEHDAAHAEHDAEVADAEHDGEAADGGADAGAVYSAPRGLGWVLNLNQTCAQTRGEQTATLVVSEGTMLFDNQGGVIFDFAGTFTIAPQHPHPHAPPPEVKTITYHLEAHVQHEEDAGVDGAASGDAETDAASTADGAHDGAAAASDAEHDAGAAAHDAAAEGGHAAGHHH